MKGTREFKKTKTVTESFETIEWKKLLCFMASRR
jgi:hypothetical protein